MVYIDLNGRLGNNLFQIATAASLAKLNNSDFVAVCLDRYSYWSLPKHIEQFKNTIFKNVKIIYTEPDNYIEYNEKGYTYSKIEYQNNIYLKGWFQSEKYFDNETVLEIFKIPEDIKDYIMKKYGYIFDSGPINSIHVRRGDYTKVPHEFITCSISYYQRAIKLLGKDQRYLVVSDDIDWCKENFKGDNFIFIENEEALTDLYLQSLCTNNIISNSTFSWWGAWLNPNKDKKVICPKKWFGIKFRKNNIKDLIPESWIKLSNNQSRELQKEAIRLYSKELYRDLRKALRPVKKFLRIRK